MVSSCPSVIQVSLLERKYRLEMQILTCLGHGWYLKPWNWMWYSREWGPWSSTERKINVLEICKERGGESYSRRRAGLTPSRMKRRDELLMRVWFVHLWQKESRCEKCRCWLGVMGGVFGNPLHLSSFSWAESWEWDPSWEWGCNGKHWFEINGERDHHGICCGKWNR